jgi:hypothetical protein
MLGVIGIPEGLIHVEQYAPKGADATGASGETWISTYISGLALRPGFEVVRSLGLVRDADQGARSKLQGLQHHLREAGLPVPRNHGELASGRQPQALTIGIFVMPDGRRRGALEDLYLDAIEHFSESSRDRALACVDAFVRCLDQGSRLTAARRKKARLHAWLASRTDPATRPGQAITWNVVPWDCPPLSPIRDPEPDPGVSAPACRSGERAERAVSVGRERRACRARDPEKTGGAAARDLRYAIHGRLSNVRSV